jgi:hypothetical protein
MKNPRLRRDVQPIPVTVGQRRMLSFHDPLRIAREGIALDQGTVPLLRMLDGSHDLRDIQIELMRRNAGHIIPMDEIEAFIRALDDSLLLESDRFAALKCKTVDDFCACSDRAACLAGKSYEKDPERLAQSIVETQNSLPPLDEDIRPREISGILAPHIDTNVAWDVYVDTYRYLAGRCYDLVIILGINHNGSGGLWSISGKDYLTPLGRMEADREFVAGLKAGLPEGSLAENDFDHKAEHSIEFQTVFLRHFLGGVPKIVPILCGSIHEFIRSGKDPLKDGRFLAMKQGIHDLIAERGLKTLFVSGVDFSHIGPKFGHDHPAEVLLPKAAAYDEAIIRGLMEANPELIFEQAARTGDYYNVCGLPSMLLFSWLMGPCTPKLLHCKVYDEKATQSAVTYASMIFTR